MVSGDSIVKSAQKLNVFERGDRRAPHKPLLLLIAIAELERGNRKLEYGLVEEKLLPLLRLYAPPVKTRHQPQLPYWYLQSDGLWEVSGAESMARQKGNFPVMGELRKSTGCLPDDIGDVLAEDARLRSQVVQVLLDSHFPESRHDDLRDAIGLASEDEGELPEPALMSSVIVAATHRSCPRSNHPAPSNIAPPSTFRPPPVLRRLWSFISIIMLSFLPCLRVHRQPAR